MAIDQEFLKSIGIDDEDLAGKLIAKTVEDESGLLSKRDELLEKVTGYKGKLKNFEGVDADEYRELKARIEKINEADMMDKGEFEKIRAKMVEDFEKERGISTEQNTKLMTKLETLMIDNELLQAIEAAGGNSKLLTPVLRPRMKVVDSDNDQVVKVTEPNGDPAVDKDGKPITISALVESLKSDAAYAGAFDASGLSGSGARPAGDTTTKGDEKELFGAKRLAAARNK